MFCWSAIDDNEKHSVMGVADVVVREITELEMVRREQDREGWLGCVRRGHILGSSESDIGYAIECSIKEQ